MLLGNFRGGLIVASAIPLSMLFAFTGMVQAGLSGNLMSLGAIDFGLIVDGSVVMIENIVRRLGEATRGETKEEIIREAGQEVARPIFFAVLIIIIVYLPILALQGVEGKMFRPMAHHGGLRAGRLAHPGADADAGAGGAALQPQGRGERAVGGARDQGALRADARSGRWRAQDSPRRSPRPCSCCR